MDSHISPLPSPMLSFTFRPSPKPNDQTKIGGLATTTAWHKVIPTRPCVRYHASQLTLGVEHNTIRTGASTSVHLVAAQNRELLIRPGHVKVDSLIVVLSVRVVVAADLHSVLVVRVALCHGLIDVGLPVASAAAGIDAGLTVLEEGGREVPGEGKREEGGEGELLERFVWLAKGECVRVPYMYRDQAVEGLALNIIILLAVECAVGSTEGIFSQDV